MGFLQTLSKLVICRVRSYKSYVPWVYTISVRSCNYIQSSNLELRKLSNTIIKIILLKKEQYLSKKTNSILPGL